MEENAALILFSGIETHVSADEYAPFEANRNFLSDGTAGGGGVLPHERRNTILRKIIFYKRGAFGGEMGVGWGGEEIKAKKGGRFLKGGFFQKETYGF